MNTLLPLVPSDGQLAWQRKGLGTFIHFGINTFHGKEWSDGTLPALSFDPTKLDARQWAQAAKDMGARYLVLTAKHHDGFCLWPTATTEYSVSSSPWRGGQGDVVREVADACAEAGLGLGLYLSPWDRNAKCYADADSYDEFYAAQLTELCSNYGPLVELWFDGAGSEGRTYDWHRFGEIIAELQPEAMIFNMGRPTIRWVGNEDGLAQDPVRYVVDRTDFSQYTTFSTSLDQALYLPPECDVSLRRLWFWHSEDKPKSVEHLLAIHERSIGLGANLLLNLSPSDDGLIADEDLGRLSEWRAELDKTFADPIEAQVLTNGETLILRLPRTVTVDHIELVEKLTEGQRVTSHQIRIAGNEVAAGQTIGVRRIHRITPTTTESIEVVLSGKGAQLEAARVYANGYVGRSGALPENYRASVTIPDLVD